MGIYLAQPVMYLNFLTDEDLSSASFFKRGLIEA